METAPLLESYRQKVFAPAFGKLFYIRMKSHRFRSEVTSGSRGDWRVARFRTLQGHGDKKANRCYLDSGRDAGRATSALKAIKAHAAEIACCDRMGREKSGTSAGPPGHFLCVLRERSSFRQPFRSAGSLRTVTCVHPYGKPEGGFMQAADIQTVYEGQTGSATYGLRLLVRILQASGPDPGRIAG
jgi:hypothetical protein